MPEKCQFCKEIAVILETLEDGKEERICIECGSFATGAVSKEIDLDSDFDDVVDSPSHTKNVETASICESCGISVCDEEEDGEKTICSVCLKESQSEGNQIGDTHLETSGSGSNENGSKSTKDKSPDQQVRCVSCKSSNLSHESVNGDERLICLDCGCVNSDVVLTNDAFYSLTRTDSNYLTNLPRFSFRKRPNIGYVRGLEKIKHLCSKYCFPTEVKTEAEEMFKIVLNNPKVVNVTITMKQNIGAACLFIICRQRDFPISLTLFKDDVQMFKSYVRASKHVLKILNIHLPHMSVTNQMVSFLCDIGFGNDIVSKVKDILFLFRKAWLTQGRARQGLITIAAYYAYLSSNICNRYMSIKNFCNQHKISNPSQNLAKECKVFLFKLAQSLPWVNQVKLQVKNVHFYINDIIKYQESLFHMIFIAEDGENIKEAPKVQNVSENAQIFSQQNELKRKEVLMPSAAKRRKKEYDQPKEDVTAPPDGINLDAPELQEDEFEEEISSYILSPEEEETMREDKISVWEK